MPTTKQPPSCIKRSLLDARQFTITIELVPSRAGYSKGLTRILDLASRAADDERIQAVSITENAGGHPALTPEVLGNEIQEIGLEVISHFSCKDKNRNQMESLLFGWHRQGLHNLLIISGDYPQKGYLGNPKPVFDLDSVHVLDLISRMNAGRFNKNNNPSRIEFQPTSFFKGVAVSPFKLLPSELHLQYIKLTKKIHAGADYVITQLGFDARKFHEVLQYMKTNDLSVPVLGYIFIPNFAVVESMHKGKIPGCIIPEKLYSEIHKESKSVDGGKKAGLVRAAKLLSVLKGIGFSGAHIGGPRLTYKDLDFVIGESEKLENDWQELIPELSYWPDSAAFYFSKDEENGLNLPVQSQSKWQGRKGVPFSYNASHSIHNVFFKPSGLGYQFAKKLCIAIGDAGYGNYLMQAEYLLKILLFGCHNCGDCRLKDLAYICPQSKCAKFLLNGPCGGSLDGWCEVYPGQKSCFYVQVYNRLKEHGLIEKLEKDFYPPRDWSLDSTSSWLNYYRSAV